MPTTRHLQKPILLEVPAAARNKPEVRAFVAWLKDFMARSPTGLFGELKEADKITIPEILNTPEFNEAWDRWIAFRRRERYSIRPASMNTQLAWLATFPIAANIAAIDRAINSVWRSLHPDKETRHGQSRSVNGTTPSWKIRATGSFE